ncbi:caspase-8 [Stomoxys calcitrans]|uniref:Caspase family p20 domain-containing protein n=1 Tax=Stomoxys calcitrans TaxID=35570 RepID=A0A1I8PI09_STOCA|nr:caspase-8 [Stomoxys calcitrans]
MGSYRRNIMERINDIDIDDLEYVERDLCFYELVSLGFLLYGREKTTSEYILQKLIVLQQNPPKGKGNFGLAGSSDILRKYATINNTTWRVNIVEALAIIRAKKVLRKLGFSWQELHDIYLPHIPEVNVYIHPLLKALYKISERLSIAQAGRMVIKINETYLRHESQNLRFYDYGHLEVFLLFWMTRDVIAIGNQNLQGADVLNLISYFKQNDLDSMKAVLVDTINHNSVHGNYRRATNNTSNTVADNVVQSAAGNAVGRQETEDKDSGAVMDSRDMSLSAEHMQPQPNGFPRTDHEDFDCTERYVIRKQQAGYVLIINQSKFYEETNPEFKNLLPKIPFKPYRAGTDVDRDNLKALFSSFGYTPLVRDNLTHEEMQHVIGQTVQKSLIRDSLIVCILTHGMEGVVYGCNSIPVSINTIKAIMAEDTLKGKPKLLIIQACQKNIAPLDTSVSNAENQLEKQPDAYADMLTAMSSIAGTEALRHTMTGSWFIESLCKLTAKWCTRKHMLDILTNVIADVAKRHDKNEYMLPIMSTTLRKDFFLPPPT